MTLPSHMTEPIYRFPFYWEFKTFLLLYLSLPQFEARAQKLKNLFKKWGTHSQRFAGLDVRLQNLPRTIPRPKRVRHRREHRLRAQRDPPIRPVAPLRALGHPLQPAEQNPREACRVPLKRIATRLRSGGWSALPIRAGLVGRDGCALLLGHLSAIRRQSGGFDV